MSFQNDLVNLLEQFGIKNIDSFDRLPPTEKHYFVSRLYKCFDSGSRNLGQELSDLRGLKLHYRRNLGKENLKDRRMEDTFYKKLAFYTCQSVITCPIEEASTHIKPSKSKRIAGRERFDSATISKIRGDGNYVFGDVKAHHRTHGGEIHVEGRAYVINRSALVDMLGTVLGLKEAITNHLVYVLPAFPDKERELNAALRKAKVTRGNFERDELVRQFTERDLQQGEQYVDVGLTRIYLPHLTNVPFTQILEVREKEKAAFTDFQAAIDDFVYGSATTASEEKIEQYLKRVDDGVRNIRAKLVNIERERRRTQYEQLVRFMAVFFVTLLPAEIRKEVASFIGTITAFDYLRSTQEYQSKINEQTSGEFYIAWQLSKLGK
jgi:hypothetical protein